MTEVAVLTPPGSGAIAVVAIRGPLAECSARALFRPAKGIWEPRLGRVSFGHFGAGAGDEILVVCRGADEFEIHCHGGIGIVRWIVNAFVECGATEISGFRFHRCGEDQRALEPLAKAVTVRTASILLDQYRGAYLRSDPLEMERFAEFGKHLVKPWKVVIAGPPNAGKSSLINALAGYQRSVVAPIPGTTRDVVRALVAFDGWPVELADTAGMRTDTDELESAGIARAEAEYASADLRIWLVDLTALVRPLPPAPAPEITVGNKLDLLADAPEFNGLLVSASRGDGLPALISAIVKKLIPEVPPPGSGVPFVRRPSSEESGAQ